jgi:predicted RNA binding protein YcfA (HicA-like mRNA interferase family)
MPRIFPVDAPRLIRFFESIGFRRARIRGGHLAMSRGGTPRPVVIPLHGEIDVDIILSNLRTADVSREDYLKAIGNL